LRQADVLVSQGQNMVDAIRRGAKDGDSIKLIRATLNRVKGVLGAPEASAWRRSYYQYCNRLAAPHALNSAGAPAPLLYVYFYFYGDTNKGRTCPRSEAEWKEAVTARERHVGLPPSHQLDGRIHEPFLDVRSVD
jgi:hypothetical protein